MTRATISSAPSSGTVSGGAPAAAAPGRPPAGMSPLARGLGGLVLVWLVLALLGNFNEAVGLPRYFLVLSATVLFWITQATSWNILSGYAGYFSFGQGAYLAVGAYTTAVLNGRQGWNFFVTLPLGAIAGGLLALAVGAVAFRLRSLRGEIFALLTLAVPFILAAFARINHDIDGGQGTTVPVPPFPAWLGDSFQHLLFQLNLAVAALAVGVALAVHRSRLGHGLAAIHDAEDAAEVLGVPTFRYKMIAIVLGGALGGLSGSLFTLQIGFVTVESVFTLSFPLFVIVMSVLGGRTHWLGPVVGAILVVLGQDLLAAEDLSAWSSIIFGLLLAVLVVVAGEGLYARLRAQPIPALIAFALVTGACFALGTLTPVASLLFGMIAGAAAAVVAGWRAARKNRKAAPGGEGGPAADAPVPSNAGSAEPPAASADSGTAKAASDTATAVDAPTSTLDADIRAAGDTEPGSDTTTSTTDAAASATASGSGTPAGTPDTDTRTADETGPETRPGSNTTTSTTDAAASATASGSGTPAGTPDTDTRTADDAGPETRPGSNTTTSTTDAATPVTASGSGTPAGTLETDARMAADAEPGAASGSAPAGASDAAARDTAGLASDADAPAGKTAPAAAPGSRPGGGDVPLVEVVGVSKYFGGVRALQNVSFSIGEGEIVGLVGPNGSGKTTMVNLLSGALQPSEGVIRIAGRPIGGLAAHRIAHAGVARTYQIPKPFASMNVLDNVAMAVMFGRDHASLAQARRVARRHLATVHLEHLAEAYPSDLNLHQRQLLEMARAIAADPIVLLLDECLAGLNPAEIDDAVEVIRRIHGSGISIIIVEHLLRVLRGLATRLVVIDRGVQIADGEPAAVLNDPAVVEAYVGRQHA